MISEKK